MMVCVCVCERERERERERESVCVISGYECDRLDSLMLVQLSIFIVHNETR